MVPLETDASDYPWLGWFVGEYPPGEKGLGHGHEKEREHVVSLTGKVEDQLEKQGMITVLRLMGQGKRRVAIASRQKGPDEVRVSSGFLKSAAFTLSWTHEPGWASLEEYLPNPLEKHWDRNRVLYSQLATHGDDHSAERPVDFSFFFKTDEARDIVKEFFIAQGDTAFEEWRVEEGDWRGLQVTIEMAIDDDEEMAEICAGFEELADRAGGEFDGWASPVKKG
jgi:hypothetical protein